MPSRLLVGEHAEYRERFPVLLLSRVEPFAKLLDLNVEVANSAESLTDPAELLARLQGGLRQDVGEERQGCSESAGCDAHVVEFLDVVSEPRARLLREHHGELPPQDGESDVPAAHPGVDLDCAESLGS